MKYIKISLEEYKTLLLAYAELLVIKQYQEYEEYEEQLEPQKSYGFIKKT